jgi:hypothetical protein
MPQQIPAAILWNQGLAIHSVSFKAGRVARRIGVAAQWTAQAAEAKIPKRSFQDPIGPVPIRLCCNSRESCAFIVTGLYTKEFYLQSDCGNVLWKLWRR